MNRLLNALQNPGLYDHHVSGFTVVETHISWVILTGDYAYKIKKPVKLEFLDFSTLQQRYFYCQEELRLNRRIAADYYLDVIAITGTKTNPAFNGTGRPIEYAIKMKQFPQDCQLDRLLARGKLELSHIRSLAESVADFHGNIATSDPEDRFGTPATIKDATDKCFDVINAFLTKADDARNLSDIQEWCDIEHARCCDIFRRRKQQGYIKECHGDMHLRNIAFTNNKILIFDCIEFEEDFRWIDVMSEIAFVVMDLDSRNQPEMASEFLNYYLEQTGDYRGLEVLRYYLVYRALVRAKVDCIRAHQADISASEKQEAMTEFQRYIGIAKSYLQTPKSSLVIMHGLSGSGKTWVSSMLLRKERMIRIRSDIERKRLLSRNVMGTNTHTVPPSPANLYSANATDMTYNTLYNAAYSMLDNHWSVIVDATFLKRDRRGRFQTLAETLSVNYYILECIANRDALVDRINHRLATGSDASDATEQVLKQQIDVIDGLSENEKASTITVDTSKSIDLTEISNQLHPTCRDPEAAIS